MARASRKAGKFGSRGDVLAAPGPDGVGQSGETGPLSWKGGLSRPGDEDPGRSGRPLRAKSACTAASSFSKLFRVKRSSRKPPESNLNLESDAVSRRWKYPGFSAKKRAAC